MKQIIVIHGGTTFSSYDKYLDYLRKKTITAERLTSASGWKNGLQSTLGHDYQVLLPSMPNATNAQYDEWKLWFERIVEVITDDCILIGHSLGAVFLVRYLSENVFPKQIAATILIAAPFNDESDEDLTDFKLTQVPELFADQAGRVIFFMGSDDPVVAPSEIEKYRTALPTAEYNILSAPDHFVRPEFPELIRIVRSL
jgi:predicted alpha/beta hydrolase family esterase